MINAETSVSPNANVPDRLIYDYSEWMHETHVGEVKDWAGGKLTRTGDGGRYVDPQGNVKILPKDNPNFNIIADESPFIAAEWFNKYKFESLNKVANKSLPQAAPAPTAVEKKPPTLINHTSADRELFIEKSPQECAQLMDIYDAKNIGNKKEIIVLPKIPKVTYDAHSVETFNKKQDKIVLSSTDEERYFYCFANELFITTKQVKPTKVDLQNAIYILSRGATREGVYRSVVLDSSYGNLEKTNSPIKEPALSFSIYFYNTYTDTKTKPSNFRALDFYSLKRVASEKALETIDAFGENRNDLESWYAVFSSDLAEHFPQVWTNNLRGNTSKEIHKSWASNKPIQHVKSEVVLKLHAVLNSLM